MLKVDTGRLARKAFISLESTGPEIEDGELHRMEKTAEVYKCW